MTSHMSNLFILDLFLVYIDYMKASTFIFLKFIKVYLPKLIFFNLIKTTFLALFIHRYPFIIDKNYLHDKKPDKFTHLVFTIYYFFCSSAFFLNAFACF